MPPTGVVLIKIETCAESIHPFDSPITLNGNDPAPKPDEFNVFVGEEGP